MSIAERCFEEHDNPAHTIADLERENADLHAQVERLRAEVAKWHSIAEQENSAYQDAVRDWGTEHVKVANLQRQLAEARLAPVDAGEEKEG